MSRIRTAFRGRGRYLQSKRYGYYGGYKVAPNMFTAFNAPTNCFGNWVNCANAFVDGGVFAHVTLPARTGVWNTFNFNIPDGTIICDIDVWADIWRVGGLPTGASTCRVWLSPDSGATLSNQKAFMNIPLAETTMELNSDTWGRIWTPAEINGNGFSVLLRSGANDGDIFGFGDEIRLDYICIRICYYING